MVRKSSLETDTNKDLKQVGPVDLEEEIPHRGIVRAEGLRPRVCLSRVPWVELEGIEPKPSDT